MVKQLSMLVLVATILVAPRLAVAQSGTYQALSSSCPLATAGDYQAFTGSGELWGVAVDTLAVAMTVFDSSAAATTATYNQLTTRYVPKATGNGPDIWFQGLAFTRGLWVQTAGTGSVKSCVYYKKRSQ